MNRRLGWEIERLILFCIVLLGLLNFLNLLPTFWGYVSDVIGWVSIAYVIYVVSPTELFFGERHARSDFSIVIAYVIMSVKDLIGNATATLPSLLQSAPQYIKFVMTNVTTGIPFVVSPEEFNTLQFFKAIPDKSILAIAPHFTLVQQQLDVVFINGTDKIGITAFPTTLNGAMLMFYNSLVQNAAIIEQVSLVVGMTILLAVSIYAAYTIPVKKPSILSVLKEEGPAGVSRVFWVFLLFIGFFVIVFNLLFEWMTITNDAPLLAIAIITLGVLFILHHRMSASELLEELANVGEDFYKQVIHLFMDSRTILLGLSGFLVLHLITDVGNFVAPAIFGWYQTIYVQSAPGDHNALYAMMQSSLHSLAGTQSAMVVVAYVLSTVGIILLLALPGLIWYKLFKLRITGSHEHLPDWKGWQTGIVLACIAVYIIVPVFSFATIKGGDLVGVNLTSSAIDVARVPLALEIAAGVFLLCVIIGFFHDIGRKILMLGPFGAATVFFGIYVYYYFSSSFVYYATSLVDLVKSGTYLLVPIIFIIFGFTILFFVTGFLSFIYEVWRE